jgi:hypothetical protein
MILVPVLMLLAAWSFAVFTKVVYRLALTSATLRGGAWDQVTAGFFAGHAQPTYVLSLWDGGPRHKGRTLTTRATMALGGYALTVAGLALTLTLILVKA